MFNVLSLCLIFCLMFISQAAYALSYDASVYSILNPSDYFRIERSAFFHIFLILFLMITQLVVARFKRVLFADFILPAYGLYICVQTYVGRMPVSYWFYSLSLYRLSEFQFLLWSCLILYILNQGLRNSRRCFFANKSYYLVLPVSLASLTCIEWLIFSAERYDSYPLLVTFIIITVITDFVAALLVRCDLKRIIKSIFGQFAKTFLLLTFVSYVGIIISESFSRHGFTLTISEHSYIYFRFFAYAIGLRVLANYMVRIRGERDILKSVVMKAVLYVKETSFK